MSSTNKTIVKLMTPFRCLTVIILPSHCTETLAVIFWADWVSSILAFVATITNYTLSVINLTPFTREVLFAWTTTISITTYGSSLILTLTAIWTDCARYWLVTVSSLPSVCACATAVSEEAGDGSVDTGLSAWSRSTWNRKLTMCTLISHGAKTLTIAK